MIDALLNSIGLGFLFGISILGYAVLLMVGKHFWKKYQLPKIFGVFIITIYFTTAMVGMLRFPSLYYYDNKESFDLVVTLGFLFTVITFFALSVFALNYLSKSCVDVFNQSDKNET